MTQERLEEIILRTAESIAGTQLTGPRRVSMLQSLAALLLGPESGQALSERDTGSLDEHIQARLRAAQDRALEACGVEPDVVEVRFVREHVADESIEDTVDPTVQATGMATIVQTAGTLYQPIHRVVFTNDAGLAGLAARYGKEPDALGTVALDSGMRAGLSSRPGLTVVSIAQDLAAVEGAIVESLPVGRQRERLRQESRGRDLVGTILDNRYRIDHFIGRGGFGVVYRASLVLAPDIRVAIKVIDPRFAASTSVRESFKWEFDTLATLTHPSVVEWKDFGETSEGGIYIAMTYLDGEELSKVLKQETKLAPARAYPILLRILDALRYVHGKNVFHLDLKPANIFLVRDGARGQQQVKLIDFGISLRSSSAPSTGTVIIEEAGDAKEPRQGTQGGARKSVQVGSLGSSLTATQRVVGGTPLYASPEQCKHLRRDRDSQTLTGASDIYSFGVVAYQLLTGRYPYAEFPELERRMRSSSPDEVGAARLDAYRVHLEVPPIPLRRLAPKLDRRLGRLLERTLAKSPQDRFKSTEDCYQQFKAVLEPAPVWLKVFAGVLLVAVIALAMRAVYWDRSGVEKVGLVSASDNGTVDHVSFDDGPTYKWPQGVTSDSPRRLLDKSGQEDPYLMLLVRDDGFELRRRPEGGAEPVEDHTVVLEWPYLDIEAKELKLGLDPALDPDGLVKTVTGIFGADRWISNRSGPLRGLMVPSNDATIGPELELEFEIDPAKGEFLRRDYPASCTYTADNSINESQLTWRDDPKRFGVRLRLPPLAETFSFALKPRPRASSRDLQDLRSAAIESWPEQLPVVKNLVALRKETLTLSLHALSADGAVPKDGQPALKVDSELGTRHEFIRRSGDERPEGALVLAVEAGVVPNELGHVAVLRCGEVTLDSQPFKPDAPLARCSVTLEKLMSISERDEEDGQHEWLIELRLEQADGVLGATRADEATIEFRVAWDPAPVSPTAQLVVSDRKGTNLAFEEHTEPARFVETEDKSIALELNGKGPMRFLARLHSGDRDIERKELVEAGAMYPRLIEFATQGLEPGVFPVELEVRAWSAHEGSTTEGESHFRFACPVERLVRLGVKVKPIPLPSVGTGPSTPATSQADAYTNVASWSESDAATRVVAVGTAGGGLEFQVTEAYRAPTLTINGVPIEPTPGPTLGEVSFRWNPDLGPTHAQPIKLVAVFGDEIGLRAQHEIWFTASTRDPEFKVIKPLPEQPWPGAVEGNNLLVTVEVESEQKEAANRLFDSNAVSVRIVGHRTEDDTLLLGLPGKFTSELSLPYAFSEKKVTLEFAVRDRTGRVARKVIENVTVPKLQFTFPNEICVELVDGVVAGMLFVPADNDARGTYRLLEFEPDTTWSKVLGELGERQPDDLPAYRDKFAFEKRLTVDGQFWTWAKNAPPPATDHSYYLDRCEVSVAQFQGFVDAANFKDEEWWPHLSKEDRVPAALEKRRRLLTKLVEQSIGSNKDVRRPIVGADWNAANAFALWSGRRLQSWFEWEYATRGGTRRVCIADREEIKLDAVRAPPEYAIGFVHLTGNVAEWTCTPQFKVKRPPSTDLLFTTFGPPEDPTFQNADPSTGRYFVVVGGAVVDPPGRAMYFDYTATGTSAESPRQPHSTLGPLGFRCALTVGRELADFLDKELSPAGAATTPMVPARELGAATARPR